jgi:hypothetical protein
MKNNKLQKERDKATSHLMTYVEKPKWGLIKGEYFADMWATVANGLGVSDDEIIQRLMDGGYLQSAIIYLLESVFTLHWQDEPMSLLEEYLKQRGWRETPHARQYLRALSQSTVGLFEVVDVKKGEYMDVKELTFDEVQRIYDKSGSQNVAKWSWFAARVLPLGKRKILSGSVLLLSADKVEDIQNELERYRDVLFEELKKENKTQASEKLSTDTMRQLASIQTSAQMQDIIFTVWATQAFITLSSQARPILRNKDDELFKDLTLKFPVTGNNNKDIIKKLNKAQFLDCVEKNKRWAWINCDKNNIPTAGTTLLGEFTLQAKTIKLTVNSDGRAEKGKAYLKELLGEVIGEPLMMENNIDKQLEKYKNQQAKPNTIDVDDKDVVEVIHATLTQHYQKVLDEEVPSLGNKTPRQCAKNKNMHNKLIQWLKDLEHSTARATPEMQSYDFRWMWDELSLKYPKND